MIESVGWDGQIDADYCLFEVDEASLPVVASEVNISAVVVTNLFRDQLDRFGELDTTARLIEKGITRNASLAILNADDPNVAQLASTCTRIYFGIESVAEDTPLSSGTENWLIAPDAGMNTNTVAFFMDSLDITVVHNATRDDQNRMLPPAMWKLIPKVHRLTSNLATE